jgi:hypothetical protein
VVAITGPGTPFTEGLKNRIKDLPPSTILFVGVAHSGIHWMAPGDLSLDSVPESIVQGFEEEGLPLLFADGQVWFLSPEVPLDDLKKLCTIEGARQFDREEILGRHVLFRANAPKQ